LDVWKVDRSYWKYFKEHYYLDLNFPPAAEYFIGTVGGELVSHIAVCPMFTAGAYRATRLVVMPEWQGAGVGTKFLELVMEYHKQGNGRKGHKLPTIFHTSHPQLIGFLNRSKNWILKSQVLFGGNKKKSGASIAKANKGKNGIGSSAAKTGGFGGHFRAVQGFKYIGRKEN
jgi:GNAT superfamily N-acetyltransferase|tara:strand:+ start:130 stop:645 length:516 start_codon:yes stop_codon:yes gene_type:complete